MSKPKSTAKIESWFQLSSQPLIGFDAPIRTLHFVKHKNSAFMSHVYFFYYYIGRRNQPTAQIGSWFRRPSTPSIWFQHAILTVHFHLTLISHPTNKPTWWTPLSLSSFNSLLTFYSLPLTSHTHFTHS